MPGDVYNNALATIMAEAIGVIGGGAIAKFCGIKNAFIASFAISLVGGLLISIFGKTYINLMPLFIAFARIGVAWGFVLVYIGNAEIFPTLFAATAMGICNFIARIVTIMSS